MKLKFSSLFYFFIIIFFILPDLSNAQEFWLRQQSPTTKRITKCFFIDENTGWVSGDSGLIMKSTNSGVNWSVQSSNTNHDFQSIFFINNLTGWANAYVFNPSSGEFPGTLLFKTTNGGNNWNSQMFHDTNAYYGVVYFLDSINGFMGGYPEFILLTTNGGVSWDRAISDSVGYNGYPTNNILFLNKDSGYACGGVQDLAGLVWKTENKGLNWRPVSIGPDALNDFYFFHPDTSIVLSGDFKFGASFYRTNNNWLSSFYVNLGYVGIAQSIDFRKRDDGWITIGYLSKLFRSTNAGNNRLKMDIPDSSAIFDIQFIDSTYGWCVGDHGAVYKYDILTSVNSNESIDEINSFSLSQNYPNPFNLVTNINYELQNSDAGFVTLKVFDILGNESATLVNEKQASGIYNVTFDGTGLSSGVYFYRLSVNGKFISGKTMMMLK